jgi:2,5-diamino-6-(ribosylamino)-4(3H)-pyrimidinone 5'-phosphate reductase
VKPYVICHMMPSVDGRIVLDDWPRSVASAALYDKTADQLKTQAWVCGTVTMEEFSGPGRFRSPGKGKRSNTPKTDWIVEDGSKSFAVAIDASGRLNWKSNDVNGDRLIVVLTERATSAYLDFLRARGISYLFAGKQEVDFAQALEKLREHFGIRRVSIQGGGKINGAFLNAGLIDELSLVFAPVVDGTMETPTVFDVVGRRKHGPANLRLTGVRKLERGVVWLRYRVIRSGGKRS